MNKPTPIHKTASLITTTVLSLISLTLLTGCTTMINKAWTHLPGQDITEGGKYIPPGPGGLRVMSDNYEKQVDEQLDSIKHQLIDAAHELSSLADLKLEPDGVGLAFRACTDQGHGPYRGVISLGFIHARKGLMGPHMSENFEKFLIQYGGWNAPGGAQYIHGSGGLTKNNLSLQLPIYYETQPHWGGLSISTSCIIDADLSAYYGKTIKHITGEDITKEFNHH